MNKFILLLLIIANSDLYCGAQVTAKDFAKLQWLVAEWNRTNLKPGMSGSEKWVIHSEKELQGLGITMKGKDTAFVEKAQLVIKGNSIYYIAEVPENKEPVPFKLISITEDSFACENQQHDFPKKIVYRKEGGVLKATISGNGKSMDYLFEKKI